ncbi:MAG: MFS transporter [Anaerolineaceae bacterium]|nr:MFS transporter [Anaerolineaceae bacterium]
MARPILHIPPALRHRRFAYMWFGLLVSMAGSQMQITALLWHLSTLSSQPIVVSGIGVARFFPILLFGPFGGLIADTINRRRVMFITQTVMTLAALALALLTWGGHIQIWHIYLLTGINAIAFAFDSPARQALMPNLVPEEILPSAFSMTSIALNTGAILGPALSGIVISTLGQGYTYLFDAVSFLAVLLALVIMGPVEQVLENRHGGVRGSLVSIKDGVQFILHQPIILSSMLLDFVATFFSSANTLLPFVARNVLHVGEVAYGWLASSPSIGAVLVGLVMSQRTNYRRQGALLLSSVVAFGLATMLFGLSGSFLLAMLALLLIGASDTVSTILRNTIRQIQTPDQMRGRMIGINQIFFMGGPQLGEIEAGLVAQAFGTPLAIISGGLGCLLAVGCIAAAWPQLRRYQGDEGLAPQPAGD